MPTKEATRAEPRAGNAAVERIDVAAYTIPTDAPESDGTLAWDSTTMVVVRAHSQGACGLGYTYAHAAAAVLIHDKLAPLALHRDGLAPPATQRAMRAALRNDGAGGLTALALSAVDIALWDLKARLLGLSLLDLLGAARPAVAIYGSGGFTSYDDARLANQLGGWASSGIPRVKMKVGRNPQLDRHRVHVARDAIGAKTALFVDANGAYTYQQALELGREFREECGVTWFEEPRPSTDLAGLRRLRAHGPAGLDIAAGEYGWSGDDFRRMLSAQAVDVLQADVTRCGGITGFLQAAELAEAFAVPLSAHCAPALHVALGCALPGVRHLEYFHDHVRIEGMFLDGVPAPSNGTLAVDASQPGLGLELKESDANAYRVANVGGTVE